MKSPDEIKKGIKCCHINDVDLCDCEFCPYAHKGMQTAGCDITMAEDTITLIQQKEHENAEQTEKIRELEAERDALKEALGLMVYQYCVRGDKLDHLYMCAGETAFRVLGLEQYGNTSSLESWLFPEYQDKED